MLTFVVAILVACALPKRVDRGRHPGTLKGTQCLVYETKPLLFYGIESALGTRIAFAYSETDDCG